MTNINYKILPKLLEKANASSGMYVQKVYKDTLRFLISTFSNVYYLDKNNNSIKIKCYHGNQERAIAKSTVGDNITLPVITISETSTSESTTRRRYSPLIINESYWSKEQNRAIRILSLSPKPVDISYNINVWTKYKQDMDQIRESIFSMFNPDMEIPTKYNKITKSFITNESGFTAAEADDTEDRILKNTITIKVETYIPSPRFLYTSTGKIETINYEIEIDESKEPLE